MKAKMAEEEQISFSSLQTRERGQLGDDVLAGVRALTPFFVLAFLFSWLVEVPLALQAQGVVNLSLPFALHYLAGYGPMAAALLLTAREGGWRDLRELFRSMSHWRVPAVWWLVAFSPLLFYLFLGVALWALQSERLAAGALGQLKFLPDLGVASFFFWLLTFGIGEETGWRGYALPRLQRTLSPLAATLMLWFFWALWHLPMFFYTYDMAVLPGFLPGLLAGALVFTWLFNKTGSILIVALWHGAFNLTTACVTCGAGIGAAAVSALVMVAAVILVATYYRGAKADGDGPVGVVAGRSRGDGDGAHGADARGGAGESFR